MAMNFGDGGREEWFLVVRAPIVRACARAHIFFLRKKPWLEILALLTLSALMGNENSSLNFS